MAVKSARWRSNASTIPSFASSGPSDSGRAGLTSNFGSDTMTSCLASAATTALRRRASSDRSSASSSAPRGRRISMEVWPPS